jgi:hypothetical protein
MTFRNFCRYLNYGIYGIWNGYGMAMEFMGHWRQRLSVALGRGRARCLEAAAVIAATWDVGPASEHSSSLHLPSHLTR